MKKQKSKTSMETYLYISFGYILFIPYISYIYIYIYTLYILEKYLLFIYFSIYYLSHIKTSKK